MTKPIRKLVPVTGVAPPGSHYSHAIEVEAGKLLFISGQVPLDENGELVAPGDAAGQAVQVMTNLTNVVDSWGGGMASIVKTTVYLTNLEDRAAIGLVRQQFFQDPPPTNALLVVSSLANPAFLVEIDAIASMPAS
jgi:2-iminobutanoate/2-iminopropanoate deaminase